MTDFGLALVAFAAFCLMIALIRVLSWLTQLVEEYGSLGAAVVAAIRWIVVPRSVKLYDPALRNEDDLEDAPFEEKRNGEMGENSVATVKPESNDPFQFPELFTGLARLVIAGEIGETDALRIATKASPGKGARYQEARRRLHLAIGRERPGPLFRDEDGELEPANYPVSGRQVTAQK